jgi:hypothetical protein
MTNGHRQRPWGLYVAVVITILAGLVLLSQLWRGNGAGQPLQPEPTGTILPAPLWTPPASHSAQSPRTGSSPVIYLRISVRSP